MPLLANHPPHSHPLHTHPPTPQAKSVPANVSSDSLIALSAAIPDYDILNEGTTKHCVFHVNVSCKHSHVSVTEKWVINRRYRDFHDLHLSLRAQVGSSRKEGAGDIGVLYKKHTSTQLSIYHYVPFMVAILVSSLVQTLAAFSLLILLKLLNSKISIFSLLPD